MGARAPQARAGAASTATGTAGAARKRDAEATRAAILDAARSQFAAVGYDRAGVRDIAAAAAVDVALIKRYFGSKEALFAAALKASFRADFLSHWQRETFAGDYAAIMARGAHEDEARTQSFRFLLRAATSPTTAPLLREAVQERFLDPIRAWLGGDAEPARARLLAAVVIGLLVERLIRDEPLQGQEKNDFVELAAGVFEAIAPAGETDA